MVTWSLPKFSVKADEAKAEAWKWNFGRCFMDTRLSD